MSDNIINLLGEELEENLQQMAVNLAGEEDFCIIIKTDGDEAALVASDDDVIYTIELLEHTLEYYKSKFNIDLKLDY